MSKNAISKKANLVLQFIILLVVAAIMIVTVTSFGASIWSKFFPSPDKAMLKSFDTLYTAIDFRSKTNAGYDSIKMTVYLRSDYQIILFDSTKDYTCEYDNVNSKKIITKPQVCKLDKPCLCLYYEAQNNGYSKPKECKVFTENFITAANQLNIKDCARKSGTFFPSIISVKNLIVNSQPKKEIYVFEDNDANRKLDTELSSTCPKITDKTDPGFLCSGKIGGEKTDSTAAELQSLCQKTTKIPTFKTSEATCIYDKASSKCTLSCVDATKDCALIKSCEDYTIHQLPGYNKFGPDFNYFTSNEPAYMACTNDPCGVGGGKCSPEKLEHYACIKSSSGETEDGDCSIPDCAKAVTTYFTDPKLSKIINNKDWTADLANSNCNALEKQKLIGSNGVFEKFNNIYVCLKDTTACEQVLSSTNNQYACGFKTIDVGFSNKIITYSRLTTPQGASFSASDCQKYIDSAYAPAFQCTSPNYNYQINSITIASANVGPNICHEINSGQIVTVTTAKQYECAKGQKINLLTNVKNIGDFPVKLKATPLISTVGPLINTATSQETTIPKDGSDDLGSEFKLENQAGIEYTIYPSVDCLDLICLSNPALKNKQLTLDSAKIVIKTI